LKNIKFKFIALYKLLPDNVYIIPSPEHQVLLAVEQTQGAFNAFQKKFNVKAVVISK